MREVFKKFYAKELDIIESAEVLKEENRKMVTNAPLNSSSSSVPLPYIIVLRPLYSRPDVNFFWSVL